MPSGSFIADKNIGWKRKVQPIRPEVASGTATIAALGGSNVLSFATGQTYRNRLPVPQDCDPTFPIGLRLRCSTPSVVPADTATWSALVGKQPALGDAKAAPATTLFPGTGPDGEVVPVVNGVAAQADARQDAGGKIASNFFSEQEVADRVELVFNLSVVLVGMASIQVHEIALDYVPRATRGEGQDRDISL